MKSDVKKVLNFKGLEPERILYELPENDLKQRLENFLLELTGLKISLYLSRDCEDPEELHIVPDEDENSEEILRELFLKHDYEDCIIGFTEKIMDSYFGRGVYYSCCNPGRNDNPDYFWVIVFFPIE